MAHFTRRGFVSASAAIIGGLSKMAAENQPVLLYVGTYSSPEGPEGSIGRGKGIYLFEMDPATGQLRERKVFANPSNPSWLALDATGTHLYSADESADGSVAAYAVNRSNGDLELLNRVSSEGAGPAHLSVHPAGKHVLVANYYGGAVAVLPIRPDGSLRDASDVKRNEGALGPANAASGPPGSFAISGHEHPHAHMIHADPSGKFVLATDLALDRIYVWRFDAENGKLIENSITSVPPGDGPRHFAFHPNGRWLYSLQEESSTIIVFDYDGENGRLKQKQQLSTLPNGFAGTDFTSEIVVTPDGRFVYAANRLHDTIAHFSVGPAGTLTLVGEEWTRGDYPRSFTIDPSGKFLFSCNQRSDAIVTFRVDKKSGALAFTGQYTPVGTPAIVVFL